MYRPPLFREHALPQPTRPRKWKEVRLPERKERLMSAAALPAERALRLSSDRTSGLGSTTVVTLPHPAALPSRRSDLATAATDIFGGADLATTFNDRITRTALRLRLLARDPASAACVVSELADQTAEPPGAPGSSAGRPRRNRPNTTVTSMWRARREARRMDSWRDFCWLTSPRTRIAWTWASPCSQNPNGTCCSLAWRHCCAWPAVNRQRRASPPGALPGAGRRRPRRPGGRAATTRASAG